jgi:hypothetical protein|tara:strand:+ start:1448 stop:2053 length:606 start_codon:yes stop_codon:yes gene_type:complete
MNIFDLDDDPKKCAIEHNDAHVVKMCTEYAQLMSTAHRILDGTLWYGKSATGRKIKRYYLENDSFNKTIYLACHNNHPSNIWLRQSEANYRWLYTMWSYLLEEYTYRYDRQHGAGKLKEYLFWSPTNIPKDVGLTNVTPAMGNFPDCIVENDSVESYRNYYWEAKRNLAKWKRRSPPDWWIQREQVEYNLLEKELFQEPVH